jgi:hypothetical protein
MNRCTSIYLLVALLAMVFVSSAARADSIQLTLTQTRQTSAAGTTVTFDATLTNFTTNTIFLNGDSVTSSMSSLTVDDNPFLNNAPLSLAAGASSGPFALFRVLIAPGTAAGTYGFNTFSILGGPDNSAFSPIGSAQFAVTVSPVPEPGTLMLLVTGALGMGSWSRFRRRH